MAVKMYLKATISQDPREPEWIGKWMSMRTYRMRADGGSTRPITTAEDEVHLENDAS